MSSLIAPTAANAALASVCPPPNGRAAGAACMCTTQCATVTYTGPEGTFMGMCCRSSAPGFLGGTNTCVAAGTGATFPAPTPTAGVSCYTP